MAEPIRRVLVVGAGAAGLRVCERLRAEGYTGELVLAGAEPEIPYDRPKLSKEVLSSGRDRVDLRLITQPDWEALDLELALGRAARGLDTAGRAVEFADGRRITADRVVLACGAVPRSFPPDLVPGPRVSVLRSLAEAEALHAVLREQPRLAVIGGGFIGAEVAATASAMGAAVTIVEEQPLPLAAALGTAFARRIAEWQRAAGIELCTGTRVLGTESTEHGVRLRLGDGRELIADHVLLATGSVPATGWLADSPLILRDGVRCDTWLRTENPGVFACGDMANVAGTRSEHWTAALEQAEVLAGTLLHGATTSYRPSGYFWSQLHGHVLQSAGRTGDTVELAEGADGVLATHTEGGSPVGVTAIDAARRFNRARRELGTASLAGVTR